MRHTAPARPLRFASAALLALLAGGAHSEAVPQSTARCIAVADGDTITVLRAGRPERIRLEGIDAPEIDQARGLEASRRLADLVLERDVGLRVTGADRYGRTLAHVYAGDLHVNLELVREGWAWHFTKYSADRELASAEASARAGRLGLWADEAPTAPWDFRSATRPRRSTESAAPFLGNTSSRVFHAAICPNATCQNCTAEFESRELAIAGGYRPAGCCHP